MQEPQLAIHIMRAPDMIILLTTSTLVGLCFVPFFHLWEKRKKLMLAHRC